MDVATITSLISNLGFPIVSVIALAWFAWYMVKTANEKNAENMESVQANCQAREDKLYAEITENRKINGQFAEIIAKYETKLDDIKEDVGAIKTDITLIKSKV